MWSLSKNKAWAVLQVATLMLSCFFIVQPQGVVQAQEENGDINPIVDKHIIAHPQHDQIDGSSWEIGTTVNLEIDDPSNGVGANYTDSQIAHETGIEDITISFQFGGDWNLQPGHIITFNDGEITETHVVQSQEITSINVETDVISGTAVPGTDVMVWFEHPSNHEIVVTASEVDGTWTADFTGTADIAYGTWGAAAQNDDPESSNHTRYNWSFENTHIEASLIHKGIGVFQFSPFDTVTLDIYDSYALKDGDPQHTEILATDEHGNATFENHDIVDLHPGTFITARDEATNLVKALVMSYLTLDVYDPSANLVAGTADPGQEIEVSVYNGTEYQMWVITDPEGNWSVTFSEDLTEEMWPAARTYDADRDETSAELDYTEPPSIQGNLTHNWVGLERFTPLTEVSIDIDGFPFSVTTDGDGNGWLDGHETNIDLVVGTIITATQGDIVKELTLVNISLYEFNVETELIKGTAPAEAWLFVNVHDELLDKGYGMDVQADLDGNWTADFGIDLHKDMCAQAMFVDDDKDATVAELPEPPSMHASLTYDWVNLMRFSPNNTISIDIDGSPFNVTTDEDGNGWLEPGIDLIAGMYLEATDDATGKTKVLELVGLALDVFDPEGDVIEGTGPADEKVIVGAGNESEYLEIKAPTNSSGYWLADFGAESLDLLEDMWPQVLFFDEDNDATIAELPEQEEPNEAPVVNAGGPYETNENNLITLTPVVSDADGDPLTYAWSYEIDEGECAFGDPAAESTSFTCQDDGEFTLTLTVSDGVNEPVTASAAASITNADPEVGAISAPIDPIEVGVTVEASASFTDAGTLDTHTSTWEWGDGSFTDGLVSEENGSGTTVGSYAYSVPGVYTLVAAVEDDDGGWDEETYQYLVVYDPSGGFVTGGGWLNSPAGAYAPDGSMTGTATFGFVSKYKKGADVPTGVTEFHFKVASLKFKSSSYDWLVVAGKKAMFKGVGIINGEGNYGFMLSCIDGDLQGGGGIDRFRIKIWDRDTEAMVYDNQMGEVDDAEPATALGGGSIVIHKAK